MVACALSMRICRKEVTQSLWENDYVVATFDLPARGGASKCASFERGREQLPWHVLLLALHLLLRRHGGRQMATPWSLVWRRHPVPKSW